MKSPEFCLIRANLSDQATHCRHQRSVDLRIYPGGLSLHLGEITTDIPARIDRLPWSCFHLLVVVALGITWVLDGLEVTIVGSIGPILKSPRPWRSRIRRSAVSPPVMWLAQWRAHFCSAG